MRLSCVHNFGIIKEIDFKKNYSDYTPQKYDCISVDDEFINSIAGKLSIMKTYFHSYERPDFGLAYYGVTIIPPDSLSLFYDIVVSSADFKDTKELSILAKKILEATNEQQYMIHYGV